MEEKLRLYVHPCIYLLQLHAPFNFEKLYLRAPVDMI